MEIKLNLVNNLKKIDDRYQVVIFQKNIAPERYEPNYDYATAWQVIEHLRPGNHHPFTYELMQISACDRWGNYTPQFEAQPGQQFSLNQNNSGDELRLDDISKNSQVIQATNNSDEDDYTFQLYRSSKLLAQSGPVTPGQTAHFQFKNTLWIGLVVQMPEGGFINSAMMHYIDTELPLNGIASADIVMTDRGDPDLYRYQDCVFTMQNIVTAEQDRQP